MKLVKAFTLGVVLAAGAAAAQDAPTDPQAVARSELMKIVGMNTGVLGNMAGGKDPYDAAKAEAAKVALVDAAARIEATFMEQGGADPVSESKPEIWTNWEDFLVKANAMGTAAGAIDVSSVETIGAGMGALGGTCRDCHTTYRAMN
jgi:cytochrome c556